MVPKDKRNHCFLVCNLRPVFERVKFDVRRTLEPFKDFQGDFDPSSTALTKRSQTLSNALKRSPTVHVFSAFEVLVFFSRPIMTKKGLLLRYTALVLYTQLSRKSTFPSKSKLTNRECCMVNLLS